MRLLERHSLLEHPLQIMLSVVKHQVNLSSTVSDLTDTEGLVLRAIAGHYLHEVDNILMLQLLQNFDLSHSSDRKPLLVDIHLDHFKSIKLGVGLSCGLRLSISDPGLKNLAESALTNHGLVGENLSSSQIQIFQFYPFLNLG